jgi:hypothetical protein
MVTMARRLCASGCGEHGEDGSGKHERGLFMKHLETPKVIY